MVTGRLLAASCALAGAASTVSAGPASAADCTAHAEAVVVHGDARFTVLSARVVRLERAPFVDDCTFTIVRRATPSVPNFTHTLSFDGSVLEINTSQLQLVYNASAATAAPAAGPPSCPHGFAVQHGVEQAGGKRTHTDPSGLVVADEAACCSACAVVGAACAGWVFRGTNETARAPANCWTMLSLGETSPSSARGLAWTIGTRRSQPGTASGGFSAASLSITLKGGATWRAGMDGSRANLGGTISSWNEVPPRSLLAGNQTYQPGVLSRDGWAVVDDTATPRFTVRAAVGRLSALSVFL
jgi:hypothetical protein